MAKKGVCKEKPHKGFADEESNNRKEGQVGNHNIYSTYMLLVRDALAKKYQKQFGST